MDPVSVSASITGLLDITMVSLKAIDDLKQYNRHTPADLASLTSSLQSLMAILDSVVYENIRARADSGCKLSPSFQALNFIAA